MAFEPGDTIIVSYFWPRRDVRATVVEVDPAGRYGPHRGWLLTRQPLHHDDPDDGETVDVIAHGDFCRPA